HAHRHARVAGIGGLDGVDGEEADGVGEVAAAGRRHGGQVTGGGARRFAGATLSHAPTRKQKTVRRGYAPDGPRGSLDYARRIAGRRVRVPLLRMSPGVGLRPTPPPLFRTKGTRTRRCELCGG